MRNRLRKATFSMRLRGFQYEILCAKSDENGMNRSEYIRLIILFATTCERVVVSNEKAEDFRVELNTIGRCINDILHQIRLLHKIDNEDVALLKEGYIQLFMITAMFLCENFNVDL